MDVNLKNLKISATWVGINTPSGYQKGETYSFEMVFDDEIIKLIPINQIYYIGVKKSFNLPLVYNNFSELLNELGNISKL
jgi:hypothetical protein